MINNNLSMLMGRKRVTMSELSQGTGLSRSTLSSIYHEQATGITYKTLNSLCKFFGCEVADILVYSDELVQED